MFSWALKQKGFTIVELLIVIVVIAILAAITIVAYNGIQDRAKSTSSQSASAQASKKLAAYAVDNSDVFPASKAAFLTAAALTEATGTGAGMTQGSTYQYSVSSDRRTYCLTTTTNGISFVTTTAAPSPAKGSCDGHGLDGVPAITNLALNPGFESNLNGWMINNQCASPTRDSAVKRSGSFSYRCTATTDAGITYFAGPVHPVSPGATFTTSVYLRSSTARNVEIYISALDASGEIQRINSNYTTIAASTWARGSASGTVPAGATGIRIQVNYRATVVNEQVWVDDAMYTQGTTLYTYADGTSTGWAWSDTPNNSVSSGPPL